MGCVDWKTTSLWHFIKQLQRKTLSDKFYSTTAMSGSFSVFWKPWNAYYPFQVKTKLIFMDLRSSRAEAKMEHIQVLSVIDFTNVKNWDEKKKAEI